MKLEDQILEWIETRDFEELDLVEQEKVLSLHSKEEYNSSRKLLLQSKRMFSDERTMISPDVETSYYLKQQLQGNQDKIKFLTLFNRPLEYRVPLYQAAMVAIFISLGFWGWVGNSNNISTPQIIEKEKLVYQTTVDTVFVEKRVEVPVIQIKEVVKYKSIPSQSTAIAFEYLEQDLPFPALKKDLPEISDLDQEIGNSPYSNEQLGQFRRGI